MAPEIMEGVNSGVQSSESLRPCLPHGLWKSLKWAVFIFLKWACCFDFLGAGKDQIRKGIWIRIGIFFMLEFLKVVLQVAVSLCPGHRASFSAFCLADTRSVPVYKQKCCRLLESNFPAQTQLSNFKVMDCRLGKTICFDSVIWRQQETFWKLNNNQQDALLRGHSGDGVRTDPRTFLN